jgi:hypothetical protein
VVEGLHFYVLFAAKTAVSFIQGDADEPGAELRLAAEVCEITERLEEGFLCDLLGIGLVV